MVPTGELEAFAEGLGKRRQLTSPVFSLLIRSRGALVGALEQRKRQRRGGAWARTGKGSLVVGAAGQELTYLLTREAKGWTCREVPMMMSRSKSRKSCNTKEEGCGGLPRER